MKSLIAMIAVIVLVGCEPREITIIGEEVREYEILRINPPKHFSVDLLDVQTHALVSDEANRKHCNRWREWSLHQRVMLTTQFYKYKGDDATYIRLPDAASVFCG